MTTPTTDKPARAPEARRIMAPRVLPEAAAYWKAANEDQLVLKRCRDCGQVHHYPRDICPFCLSDATEWVPSDGTGTIYTYSPMGRGEAAYTIAMVTLDEGVTLMTNLVDCDPAQLAIGQRVRVVFRPAEGGQKIPMFTPVGA